MIISIILTLNFRKESEAIEAKQALPPPAPTPCLISPIPKNDLFEDISSDESEAVESEKRSTYSPPMNEGTAHLSTSN